MSDREPLSTDLYTAGLALCDVRVWNTDREPTFENKDESLAHGYEGSRIRWDWDLPLEQTALGKSDP